MVLYVGNTNDKRIQQAIQVDHVCAEPGTSRRLILPHKNCKVINDSGAFPDVKRGRVTFDQALERQLTYERKSGFISEFLVSYDLLIDEQVEAGRQIKKRWDEGPGWNAVEVTVAAAEFLAAKRAELRPRKLIISCQGVTPEQYKVCAERILQVMSADDCFGFGGWCITGQRRNLLPAFYETISFTVPMIASAGLTRAHVFGVTHMPALEQFAAICDAHGIESSTDSTRFHQELTRGFVFDPSTGISKAVQRGKSLCTVAMAKKNIEAGYNYIAKLPHVGVRGQTRLEF